MAKVYSVDVVICATAYIKARSPGEAMEAAKKLYMHSPAIDDAGGSVPVVGYGYDDPRLPKVSLSPAMTIYGVWQDAKAERVL